MKEGITISASCYECGWNSGDKDLTEFIDKPCPSCGHKIVSSQDIALYKTIEKILNSIKEGIYRSVKGEGNPKIHVDISPIRHGLPARVRLKDT